MSRVTSNLHSFLSLIKQSTFATEWENMSCRVASKQHENNEIPIEVFSFGNSTRCKLKQISQKNLEQLYYIGEYK